MAHGVVYLGSEDDYCLRLERRLRGAPLWKYPTGSIIQSSPAVANGMVYIGSADNNLYALDAATGERSCGSIRPTPYRCRRWLTA